MSDPVGAELQQCETCGAVGLLERIDNHDCEAFAERQSRRWA